MLDPTAKPHLRPVEPVPAVMEDGRELIVYRDPKGIFKDSLVLNPHTAFLLTMMDGTRTVEDLRMVFLRQFGIIPGPDEIETLIRDLEEKGLLYGETFTRLVEEEAQRFLEQPYRPPSHAGFGYPAATDELHPFLSDILSGGGTASRRPDLLVAPHLDITLAGPAFNAAFGGLELEEGVTILLLGVAHSGLTDPLSLCPIDYHTPLGTVPLNREWKARWDEAFGEVLPEDILTHRQEHSIEFQVIFLQKIMGEKPFTIFPLLVDIQPADEMETEFIDQARDLLMELLGMGPALVVAGIDLAHVGLRYGDSAPVTESMIEEILSVDRLFIDAFTSGDRLAFIDHLKNHRFTQKICGAGVLYFLMHFPLGKIDLLNHHPGRMAEVEDVEFFEVFEEEPELVDAHPDTDGRNTGGADGAIPGDGESAR